jgi:hypothetical protein
MPEVRIGLRERILGYLAQNPEGASDQEIQAALGLMHPAIVGGICSALERQGQIARVHGVASGRITNRLQFGGQSRRRLAPPAAWRPPISAPALLIDLEGPRAAHAFAASGSALLSQEDVRSAVASALENAGWDVRMGPEGEREADLEAERAGEHLVLVAIGEAPRSEAREALLRSLGELLMLMEDRDATYGVALPASHQLIGLLQRVPNWVRDQLGLRFYLVRIVPEGLEVGLLRSS